MMEFWNQGFEYKYSVCLSIEVGWLHGSHFIVRWLRQKGCMSGDGSGSLYWWSGRVEGREKEEGGRWDLQQVYWSVSFLGRCFLCHPDVQEVCGSNRLGSASMCESRFSCWPDAQRVFLLSDVLEEHTSQSVCGVGQSMKVWHSLHLDTHGLHFIIIMWQCCRRSRIGEQCCLLLGELCRTIAWQRGSVYGSEA